jgi:hypothetical protein
MVIGFLWQGAGWWGEESGEKAKVLKAWLSLPERRERKTTDANVLLTRGHLSLYTGIHSSSISLSHNSSHHYNSWKQHFPDLHLGFPVWSSNLRKHTCQHGFADTSHVKCCLSLALSIPNSFLPTKSHLWRNLSPTQYLCASSKVLNFSPSVICCGNIHGEWLLSEVFEGLLARTSYPVGYLGEIKLQLIWTHCY